MTTFTSGAVLALTLDQDDRLTFVGSGSCTVTPTYGSSWVIRLDAPGTVIGPFRQNVSLSITTTRDGSYTTDNYGDQPTYVTATTNSVTGGINLSVGGGLLPITFTTASFSPYRLALFGDSRSNGGSHLTTVTASSISGEKVPGALCQVRGDLQIVFNGGISGDLVSNWNSAGRVSTTQTVKDLIAANPDVCYIQYGINDYIAGTAATTVVSNLKLLIDKIIGAGIPVIFESCNPAAPTAVSYINGYASSGGFGASAAAKLAEMQAGNLAMQAWLSTFPSNVALYVDTSSATTATDGYAKTDQTYYDGTHLSRRGCMAVAALINTAMEPYFPVKSGQRLKLPTPNGMNRSMLNQSAGRAANFSAMVAEAGTATATYQCVTDASGDLCQEYNVTVTALSTGSVRLRFDMLPDWVGASPFFPIVAGDIMQAAFDYYIDDGANGSPIAFTCYGRGRIYYSDATNEYTDHGSVAQTASTNAPRISAAETGKILIPKLAQKAAMGSANMLVATSLQLNVLGNLTGTFRLRIKNPQWGKIA